MNDLYAGDAIPSGAVAGVFPPGGDTALLRSPDAAWRQVREFGQRWAAVRQAVSSQVVGHDEAVDGVLAALVAGGHVLLESVPGLGKTRLAESVAAAVGLTLGRIGMTPDMMHADVLGTEVLSRSADGVVGRMGEGEGFRPSAIFSNLAIVDGINRATPRTQSALLEAMQEGQVTVGGVSHRLPEPFVVIACQNPLEMEGTYPLLEAALDRFMLKLVLKRPDGRELSEIVERGEGVGISSSPQPPVIDRPTLLTMRALACRVIVAPAVFEYAAAAVAATHPQSSTDETLRRSLAYGAGPRAAQSLVRLGRVNALVAGRLHVSRADIDRWSEAVLAHRLRLTLEAGGHGISAADMVKRAVAQARRRAGHGAERVS